MIRFDRMGFRGCGFGYGRRSERPVWRERRPLQTDAAHPFLEWRKRDTVSLDVADFPVLAGEVEGVLFHSQAGGGEVAAAHVGEFPQTGGQLIEFCADGVVGIAVPLPDDERVAGREFPRGAVGKVRGDAFEVVGIGRRFPDLMEDIPAGLPLGITAQAPLGEVLGTDGFAVEEGGDDLLDFREGVEPCDEGDAGNVVLKAEIEFLAKLAGEAGDFSVSGHERV